MGIKEGNKIPTLKEQFIHSNTVTGKSHWDKW